MEMVELEDVMDSQINQNTTTEQEFRLPDEIGILPIRSAVAYPGTVMPLAVGRERSKRLIADIEPQKTIFGLVAQKNPDWITNSADIFWLFPISMVILILASFVIGSSFLCFEL